MSIGRTSTRWLHRVVSLVMIGTLSSGFAVVALPDTAQAACGYTPQLLEASVSQGLPHNGTADPPLVRGKTTMVKLFLGIPSGTVGAIQIQSTSVLDVLNGGTKLNASSIPMTAATSTITSSTKSDDSAGDPKFSIPGSVLAPSSTTGAWTATFRASLSYSSTPVGALPCSGQVTYSVNATVAPKTGALRILVVPMGDGSATTPQFTTAPTSGQSSSGLQAVQNGLTTLSRILPVPDGTDDLSNATSPAGIRWHLAAGMVDLNALGLVKNSSAGLYCLNNTNSDSVFTKLDTFLQSWNSAQPTSTTTADRVIGVIDSNIASGTEAPSCWDGGGQVRSLHAWARAIHDTSYSSDKVRDSGPIMGMEVQHTLGLRVPAPTGTGDNTYHSTHPIADWTNPNRGYNTYTDTYISQPHSDLEFTTPFTNDNVLEEQEDWANALCTMGGPTTSQCSGKTSVVPNGVGTTANVAATARMYVSALSDGQPEGTANAFGTQITDAYFTTTQFETPDDPNSTYWFRAYDTANPPNQIANKQVTLHFNTTEHEESTSNGLLPGKCPLPYATENCGTFAFAVTPSSSTLGSYEIWNGAPGASGSVRLVRRVSSIKPIVNSVNVTNDPAGSPVDLTNDAAADETEPSITPDGKWILYTRTPKGVGQLPCSELVARSLSPNGTLGSPFYLPGGDTLDLTQTPPAQVCHSGKPGQGAWRADGQAGAFVENGDLYVFTFNPSNGLSSPTAVLACAGTSNLGACLSSQSPQRLSNIQHPSWSPDSNWTAPVTGGSGYRLSFDANSIVMPSQRDLYYVDPYSATIDTGSGTGVHPAALVSQQAVESSWSHAAGKGKTLEYTDLSVSTGSPIRVLDVANSVLPTAGGQISCCGRRGSFGDRFIALEEELSPPDGAGTPAGTIALLDYNQFNLSPTPDRKTTGGNDTSPAISSTMVAGQPFSQLLVFDRSASTHDIYLYNLNTGDRRSITISGTVGTPNAAYASATVFAKCNSLYDPLDTVLKPVKTRDLGNGRTAVWFEMSLDHSRVCGDPHPDTPASDAPQAAATIDDQVLVSDITGGGSIGTTRKPPTAAILYPAGNIVPSASIDLVGSGKDPWFGELTGASLQWKVYAPDGSLYASPTGQFATVPVPASGYFTPGQWRVVLTATDGFGLTSPPISSSVKVQVPTTSASSVDFDPNSLTVPIDTSGSPNVTVYVTVNGADLSKIPKGNVHISSIDGVDVSSDSSFAANGWQASGSSGQATFDKTALTTKIYAIGGTLPRRVRVTITGTSGATAGSFGFTATDLTAPCAHLQTQGATC